MKLFDSKIKGRYLQNDAEHPMPCHLILYQNANVKNSSRRQGAQNMQKRAFHILKSEKGPFCRKRSWKC